MNKSQARKYCSGCHDNFYNQGGVDGKCPGCWSLKDAKIIWRCMIHINVMPSEYHKYKKERMPSCYHRPQYGFPSQVNK